MEIEKLRSELRNLLVQDPEVAIARLRILLPPTTDRHKDLLMLEARWEDLERELTKGTIAQDDADLKRNKILEGLIDTIDDLDERDFRPVSTTTLWPAKWLWLSISGALALAVLLFFLVKNRDKATTASAVPAPAPPAATTFDTFTDSRDGQRYRTVRLAGRTWLAENLRYNAPNSVCYDDETNNCAELGRLYFWKDALTACPESWHLPSMAEWKDLALNAGGYRLNVKTPPEIVSSPAQALVALSLGGNSGFDATAGGYWNGHQYEGVEKFGSYWTSSKAYQEYVMAVVFDYWRGHQLSLEGEEQTWMLSCRCVRN